MAKVNVRDFLDEQYDLFINGEFQPSESGETLTVTNPANGEELAKVAKANEKMLIKQCNQHMRHLIVGVKFLKQNVQIIY